MKRIFYPLFILLYISSNAVEGQTIEGASIKLVEAVIESKATQQQLHESVLGWFGKAFKNSKEVITSDTKPLIVGRYINTFIFGGTAPVDWNHSIEVDIKDDKVRVRIWLVDNNPVNYFYNKKGEPRRLYSKGLKKFLDDAKELETSLNSHLNSKPDDW